MFGKCYFSSSSIHYCLAIVCFVRAWYLVFGVEGWWSVILYAMTKSDTVTQLKEKLNSSVLQTINKTKVCVSIIGLNIMSACNNCTCV